MYVRGFKTQNERLDDDVRTTISDITIFQNCLVLIFGAKFIEQKLKKFEFLRQKYFSFSFCKVFYDVWCLYNRVIFYDGLIRYKLVSSKPKCLMYSGKTACSIFNLIQPIAAVVRFKSATWMDIIPG